MLHDVGREGWLRKEKGHALTRHTPFRTLSPLGCIQGVPWYSEQEQRVRPFLDPTTDDECATHPHPVLRLVYRGRRREFSRYLISFSLISNHLLPKGICLHHKALRGGSKEEHMKGENEDAYARKAEHAKGNGGNHKAPGGLHRARHDYTGQRNRGGCVPGGVQVRAAGDPQSDRGSFRFRVIGSKTSASGSAKNMDVTAAIHAPQT